jgi:uncharacterized RDD family membrane protein YckC
VEITCPKCRYVNAGDAAFCSRCGTALAASGEATAPPSGWDLATAGMAQATPTDGRTGALRKEEFAGWWARLGASILDNLILGLLLVLVFGAVAGITYAVSPGTIDDVIDDFATEAESDPLDPYGTGAYEDDLGDAGIALVFGALIGAAIVSIAWETLWLRSRYMAKPGQAVAGFRVVSAVDPKQLSTGRAFGRACSKLLYNVPQLGGLASIATAFTIGLTEKKQALHDMIAGTACVRTSALERRGIRTANGPATVPTAFAPAVAPAPATPPTPPSPPDSSGPFV